MLKNNNKLFSYLIVVIGIFIATSSAAFDVEAQSQQSNDKKEIKIRNYQLEKDRFEPTVVQEGVMTEKQKKHSQIFKGYKDRAKIRDLTSQSGDVVIVQPVGTSILPRSFNLDTYLQRLSCNADTIVLGTVKSNSSQINEDGTFTFTDYEFTAEEVLKNNNAAPINPNADITVTRTGGAVKLNGQTIRAIDYLEVPLIPHERYLLFLRYIPETEAYMSLDSTRDDDSFQIIGNRTVQQVSKVSLPFGAGRTVEARGFMTQVRAAADSVCNK